MHANAFSKKRHRSLLTRHYLTQSVGKAPRIFYSQSALILYTLIVGKQRPTFRLYLSCRKRRRLLQKQSVQTKVRNPH